MWDLFAGMGIVMLVSAAVFLVCVQLFSRINSLSRHLLMVLAIVAMVPYVIWGRESLGWARLLPYSNLIILSNLFPEFLAVMAAELWVLWPQYPQRRISSVILFSLFSVLLMCQPALRVPPKCKDVWLGLVCMQTDYSTCSPAAAATLLDHYEIKTTEQEMARLCLTDHKGSLWMGIFRGLLLKTQDLGYQVEVGHYTLEQLRSMPGPFLLRCGLDVGADVDPSYIDSWGWEPGQQHTVVLYDFLPNGKGMIGDPSVGLEFWTAQDLGVLWHGQTMRLVKVGSPAPVSSHSDPVTLAAAR